MRVALVHDWLTGMRGGEKCLEVFAEIFPEAPIYTLLHLPGAVSQVIERHPIHPSFIQRMPWARTGYRRYLPLFPTAIERFDLSGYGLVLSSSHCVAKGVRVGEGAFHLCYCHSPMRYVWDLYDDYFGPERIGRVGSVLMRPAAGWLRAWDRRTAGRVHRFVANSEHVRGRIGRHYGREADVVYPPVDVGAFTISDRVDDYFLVVSALVPYKRVDLAVRAFNRLGLRLLIVGTGPEGERLKAMAKSNVSFLGWQTDDALRGLYARARALIFPGVEDFGLVPVEAQASGRPVIAFRGGGALESVVEGITGRFFAPQTPEALEEAVRSFDPGAFDPAALRAHAWRFDRAVFRRRMEGSIAEAWGTVSSRQ